jgi:anti-anti-sigma regulatory factor
MTFARPQSSPPTIFWRIRERPGCTTVELSGELNENVDLRHLRPRLKGRVVLHLGGVQRINSSGVREWMNFIRDLSAAADVTLSHCRPAIITQLNMISNFGGKARVSSFFAPYTCSRCDREEDRLVSIDTHFASRDFTRMPRFQCGACDATMRFDEVVDRYLCFLQGSGELE